MLVCEIAIVCLQAVGGYVLLEHKCVVCLHFDWNCIRSTRRCLQTLVLAPAVVFRLSLFIRKQPAHVQYLARKRDRACDMQCSCVVGLHESGMSNAARLVCMRNLPCLARSSLCCAQLDKIRCLLFDRGVSISAHPCRSIDCISSLPAARSSEPDSCLVDLLHQRIDSAFAIPTPETSKDLVRLGKQVHLLMTRIQIRKPTGVQYNEIRIKDSRPKTRSD